MSMRQKQRLARQLSALSRNYPRLHQTVMALQQRPYMLVRLPLGLMLIAGGFLAILPFFGLWMIPLGLLLLAIDLPMLRPAVSAAVIRLRRKWTLVQRKFGKRSS